MPATASTSLDVILRRTGLSDALLRSAGVSTHCPAALASESAKPSRLPMTTASEWPTHHSSPFAPTFEQSHAYFEARLPSQRVGSRQTVSVKCPFHDDGTASMSLNMRGTWFCHACNVGGGLLDFERKLTGKSDAECWDAINMTIGRDAPKTSRSKRGQVVATYDYHDAAGKLTYQSVRLAQPKSFQQRRSDGKGGWVWNMNGVVRVPFNLPALVRSNVALIAEGEKDVFNLQKAASDFPNEDGRINYAGTTNIGGAGKWLDEYAPYLAGKRTFVFSDNDDPGRKHAQQVCASVSRYAQAVHLVELPGLAEHGDVSDYLDKHTAGELFALMKAAPVWTAPVLTPTPSMTQTDAARTTAELLHQCRAWIQRYVVVSDEQAIIMAAWVLHTFAFDAGENSPYLHITAPEKACGKSRLMEVLEAISATPIRSGGMTAAALVRTIEAKRPTIFLDEMDAQLGGDREYAEAIRGILNEGFRKGGIFYKCVGKDFELKGFSVYCPKCLAGIGQLPDTVSSRSIVIGMRRKLPGEAVEPFRQRAIQAAAAPIRAALERWGEGAVPLLRELEPAPTANLSDRQNDMTEPLLCIAQLAGPGWLLRLTGALQMVFKAAGVEDTSVGATLLADIRTVFDEVAAEHLPSKALAERLCGIEGRPWAEWSRGKGLSANNLARQLKRFGVFPQTIRVGTETPKGYRRSDFEEAWSRYCPLPPSPTATTPHLLSLSAETAFSNRNTRPSVAVANSASNPHEQRIVADVAVQSGVQADSEVAWLNSVPELIFAVEAAGGRFMVDGGRLGIVPATAATPLMEELRQYKAELLAELTRRPAIPAGVRLIRWEPKAAPIRLSQCETVADTERFIRTTLTQLEAALGGASWLSGNWGMAGLFARLEACGCIVSLDDPRRALQ